VGNLQQAYDGERLRVKKVDGGYTTYYLRSTVLGGRVLAELDWQGSWSRGYVYLGSQLLALQWGGVYWVHQDPVVKSQRLTDYNGTTTAVVELDAWGGETDRSWQQTPQSQRYTTYLRDSNESDEAMHRRYNRWWGRFNQPDPSDTSYDVTDPQSLNRYSYVQNDPVNFVDPSGLNMETEERCTLVFEWRPHREGGGDWYDHMVCVTISYGEDTGRRGPPDIDDIGGGGPQQTTPQPTPKGCVVTNTRITYYDSPKGNTAIKGAKPVEGRTAAADPTFFGFPYPRGGETKEQRAANQAIRAQTQSALRAANIAFSIPGIGLRYFEDVGGAVDGNRIDIYVDKNASAAATKYNKQFGDFVGGVIAFIPRDMSCPEGSREMIQTGADP
jgi:RHS repeat-associated protein